jgi:hypothetical protein
LYPVPVLDVGALLADTTASKKKQFMHDIHYGRKIFMRSAVPGKLDSLVARFRDHTDQLFKKHGIKSVAYWLALDEPVKNSTFFYMLEHPSREEAVANWKAFQDDPEWKAVKAKSEENGLLVEKIDSTFLMLTDFSPPPRV